MNSNIDKLEILKSILNEGEYNDFIEVVSNKQNLISKINTTAIDNYKNNLISNEEEKELLRYIYKNIRYYLRHNSTYMPKLEEGIAVFVSKAVVANSINNNSVDIYFNLGDHSYQRDLCNPFEEIARLLLNAVKRDFFEPSFQNNNIENMSMRKIKAENESMREALTLAISKEGIRANTKYYCYEDIVGSIEKKLEEANINSDNIRSATTKENRGIILEQIDRAIDIYHIKLDFKNTFTAMPTKTISEMLKTRFDNKVVYAKRNIGVYEKTKRLVKESQY